VNCGGKGGACGDVSSTFRQPKSVIWLALAKAIDNGASLVSRATLAVWFPQATSSNMGHQVKLPFYGQKDNC